MTVFAKGTNFIVRCATSVRENLKRFKNRRAEARMQEMLFRPVPTPMMGNLRPVKITPQSPLRTSRERLRSNS